MGASSPIAMRAAVCFGLLVCAVALIGDGSAISFDDLVARADEAAHPKKVETSKPDVEMEEWSTDHLLGLDVPPPADMFDSLVNRPEPVEHHVQKAHKKVRKVHAAPVEAPKRVAEHEEHVDEDSEQVFAESLMSNLMHNSHHEKKAHKKVAKKAHKKVAKKAHKKSVHEETMHPPSVHLNLDDEDDSSGPEMVSAHISDPAMKITKKHAKKHAKEHAEKHAEKHEDKQESILSGLHSEVVPEDDEIELPSIASLPHAKHVAKASTPHFDGLQGMATAMLESADKEKEEAKKVADKKKAADKKKNRR